MISGVNGASSLSYAYQAQVQPPAKQPASQGQDSVELSNAAKGVGDADHDGDNK
jgi:hypothetical protein